MFEYYLFIFSLSFKSDTNWNFINLPSVCLHSAGERETDRYQLFSRCQFSNTGRMRKNEPGVNTDENSTT